MNKLIKVLLIMCLCLTLIGCGRNSNVECAHSWTDATCEEPEKCVECGKTRGSAEGHSYSYLGYCNVCGQKNPDYIKTPSNNQQSDDDQTNNNQVDDKQPNDNQSNADEVNEPSHTHNYSAATCTSSAKCSCGVTKGSPLGHNYNNGKCNRCGVADPNYVKTYKMGEKWVVDGQWEFTINSVEKHYTCNRYNSHTGPVVIINYTYKNLGYTNTIDLWILANAFSVYDKDGNAGRQYPCTHELGAKQCAIGMSSTGEEAFSITNDGNQITVVVSHFTKRISGNNTYEKAKFVLDF